MKTTHSFAILKVTPSTFREIRDKLVEAGYANTTDEFLEITGIALEKDDTPSEHKLKVTEDGR